MENRKTSIIIYPADFLASVHNFKKSEIANLIVAICEFNLFGATSVKLSELNKKRFDAIQQVIANHNEKWRQTCEINAQNAKRAVIHGTWIFFHKKMIGCYRKHLLMI